MTNISASFAIKKTTGLIRRQYRARQLGVSYTRSRDFRLPKRVWIGGGWREIAAPADEGTQLAFSDIWLDDVYWARRAPGPIQRVLDIGAHVGFFSCFVRSLYPSAVVHAYEPNPAVHPYTEYQARLAGFRLFGEAIGSKFGRVTVQADPNSVCTTVTPNDDTGSVPLIPFSEAVTRLAGADGEIDLLKLDCEGGEWDIFTDPALHRVRYIGMEYHLIDGRSAEDVSDALSTVGFRVISFEPPNGRDYGMIRAQRA